MAPHGEKRERVISIVVPFLAAFFMFIIASNMLVVFPIPGAEPAADLALQRDAHLALLSVIGTLGISARVRGVGATVKHLFWPNPLQWVSEITDVLVALSATLRQHRRRVHDPGAGQHVHLHRDPARPSRAGRDPGVRAGARVHPADVELHRHCDPARGEEEPKKPQAVRAAIEADGSRRGAGDRQRLRHTEEV